MSAGLFMSAFTMAREIGNFAASAFRSVTKLAGASGLNAIRDVPMTKELGAMAQSLLSASQRANGVSLAAAI